MKMVLEAVYFGVYIMQAPDDQNTLIVESFLPNIVRRIRRYSSIVPMKHT